MVLGRVLVTGGAGFIGSHLVDVLLAKGHKIRVLDNLSTGKVTNLPVDNADLELVIGDVADAAVVDQAMRDCDAVVHLAAVASVQASVNDPVATHQANFVGTLNVCQSMLKAGVKRVVFASSAATYGHNGEGAAIDEDTPKSPLTPYASDKLASEYYLDFYAREHGLEPVIFRFFNIFGPRQDPSSPYSGVISIFTECALAGKPITVFGDGEQTRDFVYVQDLVSILVQAVEASEPARGAVNVGLSRSTSLNELIAELGQATGTQLNVTYRDPRQGDIRHSCANNTRLLEHYTLAQPTSVGQGLQQLLRSL